MDTSFPRKTQPSSPSLWGTVTYLNESTHCDHRLDSESEIEFLIESNNELDYSYAHTQRWLFLYLSSNITVHCVLSSCGPISDTISIIAKFTYRWQINKTFLLLGLRFLWSANPIRGFINLLSDGNVLSDLMDFSPAAKWNLTLDIFCNMKQPKLSCFFLYAT